MNEAAAAAEREFDAVQDWTINEIDAFILYVQGKRTTSPAPLYVAIEDVPRQVGVVAHSAPAVAATGRWIEWKIPLSALADADLTQVEKICLGPGERDHPSRGSSGLIFIDDIRLTRPAPEAAE